MPLAVASYGALGLAIVCEVIGTSFLQRSEQFTRPVPTLMMTACYAGAFYFLSHAIRTIPLGVAYAVWAGLGIVLVAAIGVVVYRQTLDLAAMLGIAMIVGGVVVVNVFSRSGSH